MNYTTEQKMQFIAELKALMKAQPCRAGDRVHIYLREGCYKVLSTNRVGFIIMIKRKPILLGWHQLKCLKGHGESDEARLKRLVNELNALRKN